MEQTRDKRLGSLCTFSGSNTYTLPANLTICLGSLARDRYRYRSKQTFGCNIFNGKASLIPSK